MERYKNLGGKSGIVAYEVEDDGIKVQFSDGMVYLWNNQSAGADNVDQMKALAAAGRGLNSFIMRRVKNDWASKTR